MKKFLLTTFAVTLFLLPVRHAKAQPFNPLLASMLQDTLNYYVAAITNIKGMSASVYLPGQGIWQGTAGESYAGQPVTSDMEFGIASNTKLFVSAVMLKLSENNMLSLDDSLHSWLSSYPNINPDITIRQLLNHTSGVQDPIFLSPWMDTIMNNPTRVFTPEEVLSWVGAPLFAPGTGWSYSNVNYILAGMIAEAATGFHISQLIRDSILTPLNLDSTFYDVKEPVLGTLAHRWYNGIDYNDTSRVGLNTAGGCAGALFSNSGDMAKWYHALFTGQLLSPASYAALTTFVPTGGPYTYGLGLESQAWFGHTTYAHGGSTWGYKSRMVYDPCMEAVVCGLVNSWPAGMDGVTLLLYSVLVNHLPGCGAIITGANTVCRKENNVTYTATPIANSTTYVWSLPVGATGTSSTNSITVNYGASAVSGYITVRGNNMYGDGAISVFAVTVNSVNPGVTNIGNTLTVDSLADSYQWLDCNNSFQPIAGETGQSFTPVANGSYAVAITANGCTDTSACIVITNVGINSIAGEETGITIYPNPFTSQTIVTFKEAQSNTTIKVIDVLGQCIRQLTTGSRQLILDMAGFAKGIYFVQVTGEKKQVVNRKIIMQ